MAQGARFEADIEKKWFMLIWSIGQEYINISDVNLFARAFACMLAMT